MTIDDMHAMRAALIANALIEYPGEYTHEQLVALLDQYDDEAVREEYAAMMLLRAQSQR